MNTQNTDIERDASNDDYQLCEECRVVIAPTDPYEWDEPSALMFCSDCAHTWQHFKDEPESFYRKIDGEIVYYTAQTAKKRVAAHLKNGGKLTDKFCLTTPQTPERCASST